MSPSSVRDMASTHSRAYTRRAELADDPCTSLSFGNARMLAHMHTHSHSLYCMHTNKDPEDRTSTRRHARTHAHTLTRSRIHPKRQLAADLQVELQCVYIISIALADILLRGLLSGFIKVVHYSASSRLLTVRAQHRHRHTHKRTHAHTHTQAKCVIKPH